MARGSHHRRREPHR